MDLKIQIEKQFDPPLTPDGFHQSKLTGTFIKNFLNNHNMIDDRDIS